MSKQKTSPEEVAASVEKIFADAFEQGNTVLIPHEKALPRWIFLNVNKLTFLLILLSIFFTVGLVWEAKAPEEIAILFKNELRYPDFSHRWCYWKGNDGERFYEIFPSDSKKCEELSKQEMELSLGNTGWVSARADYAFFIIRQTGYVYIPLLLSIMLSIRLLHNLTRKIPKALYILAKNQRLSPGEVDTHAANHNFWKIYPNSWQEYPESFKKSLKGKGGKILFGLWIILGIFFVYLFKEQMREPFFPSFWTRAWFTLVLGLTPVLMLYLVSYGIWFMVVTANYLRWLTPLFKLDIQPEHRDQSGGLKRLGDICFNMAAVIIGPSIIFAAYILLGFMDQSILAFKIVTALSLTIAIYAATMLFFKPLLDIHSEMVLQKELFQDEAANRLTPLKIQLRKNISEGLENSPETLALEKQLEKLEKLYPLDLKHPTWPFTTSIILAFFSGQILPIISIVTGIIGFIDILAAK